MPELTSDQAFILAQQFHDLSVVIGNYRFDNWDGLSPDERKTLEDLQFDVLNDSSKFNGMSISLELEDLQGTLDDLGKATDSMQQAIKNLKNIGKVINIATAAVTLGAAIVSMNPSAIGSALSGAAKAVND
jgi:hypothetical protein